MAFLVPSSLHHKGTVPRKRPNTGKVKETTGFLDSRMANARLQSCPIPPLCQDHPNVSRQLILPTGFWSTRLLVHTRVFVCTCVCIYIHVQGTVGVNLRCLPQSVSTLFSDAWSLMFYPELTTEICLFDIGTRIQTQVLMTA